MHSHGEETPEEEISPRSRSSSALVLWHPKTPCSAWCASGRTCSFDCRFFHMDLHSDPLPDFVKLAEALGCAVFRVADRAWSTRRSQLPTRSMTARSWWNSSSALTPWSGRWWLSEPVMMKSRSPEIWLRTGVTLETTLLPATRTATMMRPGR